jgi:hypothetical protein
MLKTSAAIISALLVSLLISCNENPVEPENTGTFFPLSKGNKWYYRYYINRNDSIIFTNPDKEYDFIYEVVGNREFNGKDYSVIEVTFLNDSLSESPDTSYFRTEGEKLYWLYNKVFNEYKEILYADYSLSEGDTFNLGFTDYQYIGTIIEKKANSVKIYYDIPQMADEEYVITYKWNIGITDEYSPMWGAGFMLIKDELK